MCGVFALTSAGCAAEPSGTFSMAARLSGMSKVFEVNFLVDPHKYVHIIAHIQTID